MMMSSWRSDEMTEVIDVVELPRADKYDRQSKKPTNHERRLVEGSWRLRYLSST